MSPPEVRLWARLKRLRERGFHIRRQALFRGYFLDFVCFDRRIVIEVDGPTHGEDAQADHDAIRDMVLRREGFRVMRFWSAQVMGDTDGVMDAVVLALEAAEAVRKKRHPPKTRGTLRLTVRVRQLRCSVPHPSGATRHPPSP